MLHAGLDLSRNRLDVCVLSDQGEIVAEFKAPADRDGLRALVRRVPFGRSERCATWPGVTEPRALQAVHGVRPATFCMGAGIDADARRFGRACALVSVS
jgi:hypothetical protein